MAGQFADGMVDKLDDIEIVDGRVIQLMAQGPPTTGWVRGWPRCSRSPGKLAVSGEREIHIRPFHAPRPAVGMGIRQFW